MKDEDTSTPEDADRRDRVSPRAVHPLVQALRQGSSQSFNQVGERIVGRSLNVQPTITIRPGFPVRVLVTHDVVLEPYPG